MVLSAARWPRWLGARSLGHRRYAANTRRQRGRLTRRGGAEGAHLPRRPPLGRPASRRCGNSASADTAEPRQHESHPSQPWRAAASVEKRRAAGAAGRKCRPGWCAARRLTFARAGRGYPLADCALRPGVAVRAGGTRTQRRGAGCQGPAGADPLRYAVPWAERLSNPARPRRLD